MRQRAFGPSLPTVNKEKNQADQRASLRVDTRETQQEPVAKQILRRKWDWIGHTLRKPASSTTHQALTWSPQRKRKRGQPRNSLFCLLVGCLTSQQQASVSQGRMCSDNFTCCHTEIEVADQTFYLTQSQYTDTGPTSPSADPITPGAWQGSHWSTNF